MVHSLSLELLVEFERCFKSWNSGLQDWKRQLGGLRLKPPVADYAGSYGSVKLVGSAVWELGSSTESVPDDSPDESDGSVESISVASVFVTSPEESTFESSQMQFSKSPTNESATMLAPCSFFDAVSSHTILLLILRTASQLMSTLRPSGHSELELDEEEEDDADVKGDTSSEFSR